MLTLQVFLSTNEVTYPPLINLHLLIHTNTPYTHTILGLPKAVFDCSVDIRGERHSRSQPCLFSSDTSCDQLSRLLRCTQHQLALYIWLWGLHAHTCTHNYAHVTSCFTGCMISSCHHVRNSPLPCGVGIFFLNNLRSFYIGSLDIGGWCPHPTPLLQLCQFK